MTRCIDSSFESIAPYKGTLYFTMETHLGYGGYFSYQITNKYLQTFTPLLNKMMRQSSYSPRLASNILPNTPVITSGCFSPLKTHCTIQSHWPIYKELKVIWIEDRI